MRYRRHYRYHYCECDDDRYDFDDFDEIRPRLARDAWRRKIGGVCAGIARYLDVSTFWVRFWAIIALCFLPVATFTAYIVAWFLMDEA